METFLGHDNALTVKAMGKGFLFMFLVYKTQESSMLHNVTSREFH